MDPNMQIGLALGRGLELRRIELPPALDDVEQRAEFVGQVDCTLLVDGQ
jgi:hypothetical protein